MEPDMSLKWSGRNQCGLMVCPVTLRTCDRRHSCNHQWATRANRNLRPMNHRSGSRQHHRAVTRISAGSQGMQCFSTLRPRTKTQAKMKPTLFSPKEAPGKGDHCLPALSVIMRSGGSVAEVVKTERGANLLSDLTCASFKQAGKQRNSRWHPRLFITIWSHKVAQIITAQMQMRWSPT